MFNVRDRERLEVRNIMKGTNCKGGSQVVNRLRNSQFSVRSERKCPFFSHGIENSHQMPLIPHTTGRAFHIN